MSCSVVRSYFWLWVPHAALMVRSRPLQASKGLPTGFLAHQLETLFQGPEDRIFGLVSLQGPDRGGVSPWVWPSLSVL